MHDLQFIRQSPDAFNRALKRRGINAQSEEILRLDEQRRYVTTEIQALQSERNRLSAEIAQKKRVGEDSSALEEHLRQSRATIQNLEKKETKIAKSLIGILEKIPNIIDEDVPDGADEESNIEVRRWGTKPEFSFSPQAHDDIGIGMGMMDFKRSAVISGTRFVSLESELAELERALAQFMLDIHRKEFGYREILPPVLVREGALYGTGHLPKFKEDLFHTTDGFWLIPTAETWLSNYVGDDIISSDILPIRLCAWTPCFRSEAGAAGKDTKGMFRVHQFSKVELVSLTHPEQSNDELERMTSCAEEILQRLGIAYRVVALCCGDLGFSAAKTWDIEVWLPAQNCYREVSSCSNCRDFQTRRMKSRFKEKGQKKNQLLHSLNGSALAVGRTMIALLENYQNEDGSVRIPEALQPYMGGTQKIPSS